MRKDVLVFCPVLRLEPETVLGIFKLEWDGAISVLFQRDNPSGEGWADHLHQFQRGREMFLRGEYAALLVIESDILPPADALVRLWELVERGAEIAFGCYVFRASQVVNVMERYYPWPAQARNMGESLSNRRGLWEAARRMGVVDCSGSGFGCTLLTRRVVEEAPFVAPKDRGFFDWEWSQRTYQQGFRMMADTRVVCGHKTEAGEVLWPDNLPLTPP